MAVDLPLKRVLGKAHAQQASDIEHRLASVSGIDLKSTGTTNLYTVPSGKTAIITKIYIEVTTGTSVATDAVVGAGIAAGESDIIPSETLTNFRATGDLYSLLPNYKYRTAPAASVIKLGVDTAATGTTLTVTAHTIGFLF